MLACDLQWSCKRVIKLKRSGAFEDKKNPGVLFTAPAAGQVIAINRGEKRVLESVVIAVDGDEQVTFPHYDAAELADLTRAQVESNLVASGLWTALRTRPFSHAPKLGSDTAAIFVSVMDTQPLAADPLLILRENMADFEHGLTVLSRLTEGKVYVCQQAGAGLQNKTAPNVTYNEFSGPHPAGLVGTHIHS